MTTLKEKKIKEVENKLDNAHEYHVSFGLSVSVRIFAVDKKSAEKQAEQLLWKNLGRVSRSKIDIQQGWVSATELSDNNEF